MVMGGIAALAGVAGYVIANHIASLDKAGKHLNKRLDEVPYQSVLTFFFFVFKAIKTVIL